MMNEAAATEAQLQTLQNCHHPLATAQDGDAGVHPCDNRTVKLHMFQSSHICQ